MRWRLRTKLTAALLLLAVVPLAVATGVLMRINLVELERSAKEYRVAIADGAAKTVSRMVDRARVELTTLGAALSQDNVPSADRQRLARARMLGSAGLERIAVYGADGGHVFTLAAKEVAAEPAPPPSIGEGVRGVARTEGVAHLALEKVSASGWALPMVVPMFRGKTLYGFVWGTAGLAAVSAELAALSGRRFARRKDRVYLAAQGRGIIAHADAKQVGRRLVDRGLPADVTRVFRKRIAYSAEHTVGGEALLTAVVPIAALGWAVVVEQPRADAYAAVDNTWRTALIVGLAFTVIALLGGLLLGRRLSAPVSAVADGARRVAAGDFDVELSARGDDEVAQMTRAFNTMTEDLRVFRARVVEETRVRTNLSRYLSPDVVDQAVAAEADLALGGTRREVTVLFADVVAFTPLAEKHDPEFVVAVLNELFGFLTEILFKHGGTVDKFIGDCVMGVFGAPYGHDDDPQRAVRAAEEMLAWLETGNVKWRKDLGRELELGIAIHTGEAVAGNIGSERRMEYTVIGDAVNIAARLESLAAPGQVLFSAATMARLDDEFDCVALGSKKLSGRAERVEVFALATD